MKKSNRMDNVKRQNANNARKIKRASDKLLNEINETVPFGQDYVSYVSGGVPNGPTTGKGSRRRYITFSNYCIKIKNEESSCTNIIASKISTAKKLSAKTISLVKNMTKIMRRFIRTSKKSNDKDYSDMQLCEVCHNAIKNPKITIEKLTEYHLSLVSSIHKIEGLSKNIEENMSAISEWYVKQKKLTSQINVGRIDEFVEYMATSSTSRNCNDF